jgi:CheY-like chemotaxis protein
MNTILIADDHPITREPLARLLRYEGYETLTAANGLEALDLLRSRRPDLILLDMMMPKMSGLAFLEATAEAETGDPRVPVILLTGVVDSPDVARARELGVVDVITKAKFTIEQLLGRIRDHLPSARASHAA